MSKLARRTVSRTFRILIVAAIVSALGSQPRSQDTRIYYDDAMVPHIFGDDDAAAMYGLGYHHMLEFPIGTLNMLWHTSGRMAEVAGESYLDEDRVTWIWNVPGIADRHETEMTSSGLIGLIDAYVDGIEAGRAWWRMGGAPEDSTRLEKLINPEPDARLEVAVDPAPDYTNQILSPFNPVAGNPFLAEPWKSANQPSIRAGTRAVVYRMFDASRPVTRAHVLRLGVAMNSFFLLRNNNDPEDVLKKTEDTGGLASNGWMLAPNVSGGDVVTLSDGHVGFQRLAIRPYIVQVSGDQYQATGVTLPGYPGIYGGFNDDISWMVTAPACASVSGNKWQVDLESGTHEFVFDGSINPIELVLLERDPGNDGGKLKLDYFTLSDPEDPTSQVEEEAEFVHHYVPVDASESSSLGFDRYAVSRRNPPALGEQDVVFQQRSFAAEGSPWAFLFELGRATDVDSGGDDVDSAIAAGRILFGPGLNFQVTDRDGDFRYQLLARIPVQGTGVQDPTEEFLDGSALDQRWQGYYSGADVPTIRADNVTQEAWIANNCTPDLVETTRLLNLDSYDESVCAESFPTWRQLRAADLLRSQLGSVDQALSESVALDKSDNWMREMWPLFQILRGDADMNGQVDPIPLVTLPYSGGVMLAPDVVLGQDDPCGAVFKALCNLPAHGRIDAFIEWIEEYRHDDEIDVSDPSYDFVAHRFSQVTVYTTILRSLYTTKLELLAFEGVADDEEEITLGEDPLHPLLEEIRNGMQSSFVDPQQAGDLYHPNVKAMVDALKITSRLWQKGASRLSNHDELQRLTDGGVVAGDPWAISNEPRFHTLIESHWESTIDDTSSSTRMTRWGHVNVLSLTPHSLPNPVRRKGEGGVGFEAFSFTLAEFLRSLIYRDLDPVEAGTLPAQLGAINRVDFYDDQPAHALPIGGVRNSMFWINNKKLFKGKGEKGYHRALYGWGDGRLLYYNPLTSGSQTLFSVKLHPTNSASARVLVAVGGTEITESDVTGDGFLAYQDRFAPSEDFSTGTWVDLLTDESSLISTYGATHSLTYP